jgi:hypothetical protein
MKSSSVSTPEGRALVPQTPARRGSAARAEALEGCTNPLDAGFELLAASRMGCRSLRYLASPF